MTANITPLDPTILGPGTAETVTYLTRHIIGQTKAIDTVVRLVQNIKAGLKEPGRPAGSVFLMGPTGVGKTRLVEALAESLHGSVKSMVVVNCGEFQLEHEVAKLLGAPPGYLGHRETQPILSQQKIDQAKSTNCDTSIVLFDEIEKASLSLMRLLLGVLDKGTLKLGDNSVVNFEKSLIFFTSNLGAKELSRQHAPCLGLAPEPSTSARSASLSGQRAAQKNFSPEFWNRLDRVVTFEHLHADQLSQILDLELLKLEGRGQGRFMLEVTPAAKAQILLDGTSLTYGARELKRILNRHIIEPLSNLLVSTQIPQGHIVHVDWVNEEMKFGLGEPTAFSAVAALKETQRYSTKTTRPRGARPVTPVIQGDL